VPFDQAAGALDQLLGVAAGAAAEGAEPACAGAGVDASATLSSLPSELGAAFWPSRFAAGRLAITSRVADSRRASALSRQAPQRVPQRPADSTRGASWTRSTMPCHRRRQHQATGRGNSGG